MQSAAPKPVAKDAAAKDVKAKSDAVVTTKSAPEKAVVTKPKPKPKRKAPPPPPGLAKARAKPRHYMAVIGFFLLVVCPTIFANWYLHERAADQYASRLAFTIQSDEGQVVSVLEGFLSGGGGGGGNADQTEVLYGFIKSQTMVEALLKRFDLRALYNKPEQDWFYRLGDDPSIDVLVEYWQSVCIVTFSGGIVHVEVRAFDPNDAQQIAQAVLDESTAQINRMSAEARDDALRDASLYLEEKEAAWREAQVAVDTARAEDRMIDPAAEVEAALERIALLETELDQERIRLEDLRGLDASSRRDQVERRIGILNDRIAEERNRIASNGSGTLSQSVGRFEALAVDAKIAETSYVTALQSFETARAEARRKQSYLTPHIAPTLSDTPQYPERYMLGALVFVALTLSWIVLLMIGYNIKDRR